MHELSRAAIEDFLYRHLTWIRYSVRLSVLTTFSCIILSIAVRARSMRAVRICGSLHR